MTLLVVGSLSLLGPAGTLSLLEGCGSPSEPEVSPAIPPASADPPVAVVAPSSATSEASGESPLDPIQVAGGGGFGCALRRNGLVACWGTNDAGQLGQGHTEPIEGAVHVQGIDDAVSIATVLRVVCAARRNGRVACWGENRWGGLGTGDSLERRGLVEVRGITDAVEVVGGGARFCAIHRDRTVSCWGTRDSEVDPPGASGAGREAMRTTLTGVRALRINGSRSFALLDGDRALMWGLLDAQPFPATELQGIRDAQSDVGMDCTIASGGEVHCRIRTGNGTLDRTIPELEGASSLVLSMRGAGQLVGLMPDGTLRAHPYYSNIPARFDQATNLATMGGDGSLIAITRDHHVRVWGTVVDGVYQARDITLPPIDATSGVQPLPEGPIPRWCQIEADWLAPTPPTSTGEQRRLALEWGEEEPPTDQDLCGSIHTALGSRDCPSNGPWLTVPGRGGSVSLMLPEVGGQRRRLDGLGNYSDGTEDSELIDRWELRAAQPIDAVLSMSRAEASCDDDGSNCGLDEVEKVHTVIREIDGKFLSVRAIINTHRAGSHYTEMSRAPTLSLSATHFDIWVCGGHAHLPLPPPTVTDSPTVTDNPTVTDSPTGADSPTVTDSPTPAETQAATEQCSNGWRSFSAGDVGTAQREIDAALAVLTRATDERGLRARGACLYNRGRIAEAAGNMAEARTFYQRSLEARPNETVSQRLAGLSAN